ncbi:MBL fold metallo-hydrolase [Intrasporangium calvum]|uniref:Zn-dependent hydrolase n=1 Tax=Intrasporangium calvum (strain ATCC 23552 / DSM 43043 / JCM 3097 / NBRC 12989 / NCIMB 10167 / NRRL B-3866 / 7 KIP) TaxID=710696 RepID=E6SCH2_INTC7|nr:MBL fold metallo-hydrolase [Intrasporangium calvum]ADU48551.1 putative Zn-dependent hydrolase [Intrasporangium calvum DSM 43043]AXG13563.1 MBL fold metallo-hydrolase [Intrasporangium calvum]
MRVTHLGHACLLVEMADRRILIDPGNFSAGFEDLTDLDAILVTHHHPDHFDPEPAARVIRANPRASVHTDPLTAGKLAEEGLRARPSARGERFELGDVTVTPVGELHAFNHDKMPVIPNVGLVLRAEGEPSLFHPGDAYDAEPGEVDVLAHPLNAPWCASRDSIAFVARIAPRFFVPIHDALLSDRGKKMYSGHIESFAGVDGLTLRYLGDGESGVF